MAIVGLLVCTELLALLSSIPWGAGQRACSSTPVHTWLCTTTLTAILCVLQAQRWESLGISKLPKAHVDCTAPETWPAARDGQSQHARTLPAQAPPRVLSLGTGSRTLRENLPLFPVAQLCKAGLSPRAHCSATYRSLLKAWWPLRGGCAQGRGAAQRAHQRDRGSAKA